VRRVVDLIAELRVRHCQLIIENARPGSFHIFRDYCQVVPDRHGSNSKHVVRQEIFKIDRSADMLEHVNYARMGSRANDFDFR
jgi:hypothetical protein